MQTIKRHQAYQPSMLPRKQENQKVASRRDQVRQMNNTEASSQGYFVVVVINKQYMSLTVMRPDRSQLRRARSKRLTLRSLNHPKMNEHIHNRMKSNTSSSDISFLLVIILKLNNFIDNLYKWQKPNF